jgi:Tol biopolymer transport system component
MRNAWEPPIDPIMPIYYATRLYGPEFTVATQLPENGEISRVTSGEYESVPFSVFRSFSGATFWVGDNKQSGPNRQLVGANYSSGRIQQQPIFSGETRSNSYNAAVSPDGTKLAFASDRDGNVELYLLNRMTGRFATLTETNGCTNQYPSWLPDGSGLVYESDCLNGNFEIYRAGLSYTADSMQTLAVNRISPQQATRLTNNNSQDRYPRVSVDGTRIAFTANRDGNLEVYVMGVDGSRQTRVTNSAAVDQAPSWSQNGDELVFASDRDGDFELFKLRLSDNQIQQLTSNIVEDNWPVWGQ